METKRKTGIAVAYDKTAGTITWSDIEAGNVAVVLPVNELADSIKADALWHGLDQKVTDAGAMGTDHWDGKDKPKRAATTGERLARMRRVADNLKAGNWSVRVASDPLAGKSAEQLAELIAKAQAMLTKVGVKL
jgi:hypothetical protein